MVAIERSRGNRSKRCQYGTEKSATQSSLYQEWNPASKSVDGEKGIAFEYSTSITSWEQGKYHSPYIIFILISFKNADLNFSCLFA